MTKEELTKLDNYGHKELKSLTEDQLKDYLSLLEMRRQEVLDRILELSKPTPMKVR
jgi:succinate dehydrogenase flavin-adding protein (antitoxin of CptAB toxin-antitoxin module)